MRVCVCLLLFSQRRRQTPDFPPRLCLSHLLPAPSVMPTCGSSASPPSPLPPPPPTVSGLSPLQTHLLLPAAALQPPRACLLLRLMNRRRPHWLFKRKGGSKGEGRGRRPGSHLRPIRELRVSVGSGCMHLVAPQSKTKQMSIFKTHKNNGYTRMSSV